MDRRFGAALLIRAPQCLAVDRDDVRPQLGERGDPGNEAFLEAFAIEGREQIAELIVGRRAVLEGREAAQESQLVAAEQGDIDPAFGTGEHGKQAQQQHLGQRIGHLAALPRIIEVFEMLQPINNLIVSVLDLGRGVYHAVLRANRSGPG
jgi:hypothetical protein